MILLLSTLNLLDKIDNLADNELLRLGGLVASFATGPFAQKAKRNDAHEYIAITRSDAQASLRTLQH